MSMQQRLTALSAALALALPGTAGAQDLRPIAFTNARILTIGGDVIERGTIVVRDGKIEAVGADVTVPAGARVVDATGKTVMPGLVSAWSRAGLTAPTSRSTTPQRGGRRSRRGRMPSSSGGRTSNEAATKVVDGLYARQEVFGELLTAGVTSLALNPNGYGFPGLGAVLDPSGEDLAGLTLDDDAFVQIGMQRNAATKKLLKDTLAKAKQVVEEREKPKEQPKPEAKPEQKPAGDKDEKKPAEGEGKEAPKGDGKEPPKGDGKEPPKGDDKKPEQDPKQAEAKKPEAKPKPKDPNLEVLADLLQGKRRAVVQIDSAADFLHWRQAVSDDVEFPRTVAVARHDGYAGTMDLIVDELAKWKCTVLLPPSLTTKARSSYLTNPAKTLHDAGVEIGFAVGDSPEEVRRIFFQLMELVRAGLPRDVALKAVTHVPAKALGIDKRTGTIEAGKDADLLVFSHDPLDPTARLEQVWLRGRRVSE